MALDSIKSGENITDQKLDLRKLPTTAFLEQILLYIETSSPLNLSPVTQLIRQEIVTRVSTIEFRCSKIWLFSKIVELGIPPPYVIFTLILISFLTVRHMYKTSISLLCNLLGVVYPTYHSIKAINNNNYDDDNDDDDNKINNKENFDLIKSEQKQWLTYWVIYGWLQVADHWSSWLLEFIPGYNFLKLVFLYWAQSDRSRGASLIFERVLKPLLRKPLKKTNVMEKIRQPAQQQQQRQQQQPQQQQRRQQHQPHQPHHHHDNNKFEENVTSTVFRHDKHESLEEIWRDPERENEVKPYRLDNV